MTMLLKGIDHIWAVGETFHRQEHAPGDGSTLLMACWYLDAFFPLLALGRGWLSGWMFYALALPVLLFSPSFSAVSGIRDSAGRRSFPDTVPGRRAGACWASGRPSLPYAALRGR